MQIHFHENITYAVLKCVLINNLFFCTKKIRCPFIAVDWRSEYKLQEKKKNLKNF